MSLSSIFAISASGMNAAATGLEVSASNVANMRTTGTASTVYEPLVSVQQDVAGGGVSAQPVVQTPAWHLQVDPTSPDADAQGLVAAPNVDLTTEVANQLTARIAYEASAKTMSVADEMAKATLDITS